MQNKEASPSAEAVASAMFFEENALRQLLSSPYGQTSFLAILDALDAGQKVSVRLANGRTMVIQDSANALELLRQEFDWKPWNPNSRSFSHT